MSLLDLLTGERVSEFNQTRGQRRKLDLFASELAGLKLSGVDLSSAYLEKSDLTGTDLSDANLTRADLSGVDASEVELGGAMCAGSKWKGADLSGSTLGAADFSRADFAEAILTDSRGEAIRLAGARLREADCSGVVWASLEAQEARFHESNLANAVLVDGLFDEASFQDCALTGVDLSNGKASKARFINCKLAGAKLVGLVANEASFEGSDLSGADLSGADLRKANFKGAVLAGAKLTGVNLGDAILDGVDFAGLDLAGVDLTGHDPRSLGLSDEQLAAVAAVGVAAVSDAPLHFTDVAVARRGDVVAVIWENADSDDVLSLRWALCHPEDPPRFGTLPISADGVLARAVVPSGDGFLLMVLQDRTDGAVCLLYPLGLDGELGRARVETLGYEPGTIPIVRFDSGTLWMYCLARRGPTLVVQRLGEQGFETVSSSKLATARGFVGRHHPVLLSKGGVLLPVTRAGTVGAPMGHPPQFPGRVSSAMIVGDEVAIVWLEDRKSDREPGGLRYGWLARSGATRVEVLTQRDAVTALDALAVGDAAWVCWTETDRAGCVVYAANLTDGDVRTVARLDDDLEDLRLFGDENGVWVALITLEERLVVLDLDGHPRGELGGE
jgi:uncharacterized protein YjbI with pentapeptide repeats